MIGRWCNDYPKWLQMSKGEIYPKSEEKAAEVDRKGQSANY